MSDGMHIRGGVLWSLAALAVLAFALYGNTLFNGFVLDDNSYIVDNYLIRNLANIPKFFDTPPDALVEDLSPGFLRGRNVRWLTYALDYAAGGGSPFAFHLSNIIFHLLSGWALFFLFRRWLSSTLWAFAGAAIFIAHPIQTAAVAYISGRKDILAALFLFLSFLAAHRFRDSGRKGWLLLLMAAFFLAYFSKESAVVFPLLLFLSDLFSSKGEGVLRNALGIIRRRRIEYALSFGLALLFVCHQYGGHLLAAFHAGHAASAVGGAPSAAPLPAGAPEMPENLSFANLMIFYFWKLLWPAHLLADYRGSFGFSLYPPAWGGWLSPLFFALLVFLLLRFRRSRPEWGLGLAWILAALLPVSHIIPFHYPVAEHYIYLPCAGFALFIAAAGKNLSAGSGRGAVAILAAILAIYGVSTVVRNRAWRDMESITLDILKKAPGHLRAQSTLAHLYAEKGRYDEAITIAEGMLRLNPGSAINHYNLGVFYEGKGENDAAAFHYRRAIELQSTLWDAYLNLGNLLLEQGKEAEGYEVINRLLQGYGYHPLAYWVLGNYAALKGEWKSALGYYRTSLEKDPTNAAGHLGVAGALWSLGRVEEAKKALGEAVKNGLNMEWASKQPPWGRFLSRQDVRAWLVENTK